MSGILITGASRGLGAAFAAGVPDAGDEAWLVSRSRPDALERDDGVERHWVEADLSRHEASRTIASAVGEKPLDALIYNAGIWEEDAFTPRYDMEGVSFEETWRVISVNLTSAITCTQALLPNLRRSDRARIVFIGSTNGLENNGSPEVAYSASKFGMRGAAHAIRECLRENSIGVTCINPGEIAAQVPLSEGIEGALALTGGRRIPVADLVALVRCVLSLSPGTCVKEIVVPAMADRGV